ncbi:hypothetical protein SDC9_44684 [bioreactor metagenome]|uniref:Uncharacterized protein n=1 Tax=bioreactor metagenome TaxID=1076179 RepID=A0A644W413_9ZZZZ
MESLGEKVRVPSPVEKVMNKVLRKIQIGLLIIRVGFVQKSLQPAAFSFRDPEALHQPCEKQGVCSHSLSGLFNTSQRIGTSA